MSQPNRQIYVISDLHLGGDWDTAKPDVRGFRMFTQSALLAEFVHRVKEKSRSELVINGDFVDFLAEKPAGTQGWRPFIDDENQACEALERIAQRETQVFDALRAFLTDHRLVLLLGNHDIELSFPAVRKRLRQILRIGDGGNLLFLYDGEAYTVGDALIEHGNRYDPINTIDLDGLRQLRSLFSRQQRARDPFRPPPGSEFVAQLVNPLKLKYPFIDLLKPQNSALLPVLLALEPKLYRKAGHLAVLARSVAHSYDDECRPVRTGEIAAAVTGARRSSITEISATDPSQQDEALRLELEETLGAEQAAEFLSVLGEFTSTGASPTAETEIGFLDGVAAWAAKLRAWYTSDPLEKRSPLLVLALQSEENRRASDFGVESDGSSYLNCAQCLAREGWRHLIFGHTHLAKSIDLEPAGRYLNSGTWTDLLLFPRHLQSLEKKEAKAEVVRLARKLETGEWTDFMAFRPTYVRIDLRSDDSVIDSELCVYATGKGV